MLRDEARLTHLRLVACAEHIGKALPRCSEGADARIEGRQLLPHLGADADPPEFLLDRDGCLLGRLDTLHLGKLCDHHAVLLAESREVTPKLRIARLEAGGVEVFVKEALLSRDGRRVVELLLQHMLSLFEPGLGRVDAIAPCSCSILEWLRFYRL